MIARVVRKKPHEFVAHQWDGDIAALLAAHPLLDIVVTGGVMSVVVTPNRNERTYAGSMRSSDGKMHKKPTNGDWILRNQNGEYYMIDAVDFSARFEEVTP